MRPKYRLENSRNRPRTRILLPSNKICIYAPLALWTIYNNGKVDYESFQNMTIKV